MSHGKPVLILGWLALTGSGCARDDAGGELSEDAVRFVNLGAFVHAEASLASWLFDGSDPAAGVTGMVAPDTRADQLVTFLSDRYPSCATAQPAGSSVEVTFDGCPGPYGLGSLSGHIILTFANVYQLRAYRDVMFMESAGEVTVRGHRMKLDYYARAGGVPDELGYVSDVVGSAASGLLVDFTGEDEQKVDFEWCNAGHCTHGGAMSFNAPAEGCVLVKFAELNVGLDGSFWNVIASYAKCPGQCPEGTLQLSSVGEVSVYIGLDGTDTARDQDDNQFEVDCSD